MSDIYNLKKEFKKIEKAKDFKEYIAGIDALCEKLVKINEDLRKTAKELEEYRKNHLKDDMENLVIQKIYSAIIKQLMPGTTKEDWKNAQKIFAEKFIKYKKWPRNYN